MPRSQRMGRGERRLSGMLTNGLNGRHWGAKPTGRFARPEWRVSAKADVELTPLNVLSWPGAELLKSLTAGANVADIQRALERHCSCRWFTCELWNVPGGQAKH